MHEVEDVPLSHAQTRAMQSLARTHTDTIHGHTQRSPSPGAWSSYLVTSSFIVPNVPRIVPESPRLQNQDRSSGRAHACSAPRHKYDARAGLRGTHSREARLVAPQSLVEDAYGSSSRPDVDNARGSLSLSDVNAARGGQDEDPWTLFHLWSEANLSGGNSASLESTLGADSARVRAGAGEPDGARGLGLPRNARDACSEGSTHVPIPLVSDRDSVSASETDSQANFVVPVKHGSMPSQPRRKAVSEFVTNVHASLAQSSPPSTASQNSPPAPMGNGVGAFSERHSSPSSKGHITAGVSVCAAREGEHSAENGDCDMPRERYPGRRMSGGVFEESVVMPSLARRALGNAD